MSTTELPVAMRGNALERTRSDASSGTLVAEGGATEQRYLAFRLAGQVYAIDIIRIREIIEYQVPTGVPISLGRLTSARRTMSAASSGERVGKASYMEVGAIIGVRTSGMWMVVKVMPSP